MRLTKALLKEYLEAEKLIRQLDKRKASIREAIIEHGKNEFEIGHYTISIKEFTREVPAHTQKGKRVQVKEKVGPISFGTKE